MTVFLGDSGRIKLRRGSGREYNSFYESIAPDDVTLGLNRLSFDTALENLLTGDRLVLRTDDPRGLACFDPSIWSSGQIEDDMTGYINVNAVGGIRFFPTFEAAVNNDRSKEYQLTGFTGEPLHIDYTVRDTRSNCIGNVTSYTMNTDREAIDVTALSDKFRKQFSAGLIGGNGSIDCFFDYTTTGDTEAPLLLLQLIQRVEVGSQCSLALFLTEFNLRESTPCKPLNTVYYELDAVITRAGVNVSPGNIIQCTIDFVTNGEIKLLIGEPSSYILKEDYGHIELEPTLNYLLKEAAD